MPDAVVNFTLEQDDFSELQKASGVLQLPDLCLRNCSEGIELVAVDKKDSSFSTTSLLIFKSLRERISKFKSDKNNSISFFFPILCVANNN